MQYLAELAPRRGISDEIWQAALTSIMTAIQIIPQVELAAVEGEAMARIGQRDPEDWPAVAALYTEDAVFRRPSGGEPIAGREAILASFLTRPARA